MQKTLLLTLGVAIVIVLVSAWYLHASIYWKLGKAALHQPNDIGEYTVGKTSAPQLTYIALGDSLTAGVGVDTYSLSYPYVLAQKIAGETHNVHLVPFAVPGVRSAYILENFIDPVIAKNPDIITLFIGINDVHGNVSLKQFEVQYAQILASLTQKTHAQLYVMNLPFIGTPDLISLPYRYYFRWKIQQYNKIIQKLAIQYNVNYVDLYTAHEPYALDNAYYAKDLFHPNAIGYTLWAQTIHEHLRK